MELVVRPPLSPSMTGDELRRWYWEKSELVRFTLVLGISASGGKIDLIERIADTLDGRTPARPPTKRRSTPQLSGPLTAQTVIPPGQRSSQVLRAFFVQQIGSAFRFDASMRSFIEHGAGRTLGQAVEHWWATRSDGLRPIGAQFELNRFSRDWHAAHPGGSRAAMLAAWRRHRSLPADMRSTPEPRR